MKVTKKVVSILAMMTGICAAAFCDTLKADDLAVGDIKSGKKVTVNGFSVCGADKGIKVEDKSASPIMNGDTSYTKRISTRGADGYIEFKAKAGQKISVVATSGSKDKAREVLVVNEKGKTLFKAPAPAWNMDSPSFSQGSLDVAADGVYRVKGKGGGIYFFEISVE